MKRKKDLTAVQIEKTASEWKSVHPDTAKRLKGKVEVLVSEERVKKGAIFTARLRQDDLDSFKKNS